MNSAVPVIYFVRLSMRINAVIKKRYGITLNASVVSGMPNTGVQHGKMTHKSTSMAYTSPAYIVTAPATTDIHAASFVFDHSVTARNAAAPPKTNLSTYKIISDFDIGAAPILFLYDRKKRIFFQFAEYAASGAERHNRGDGIIRTNNEFGVQTVQEESAI